MTHLERVIHATRRRLWLIRWLNRFTMTLAVAVGVLAVITFLQRAYEYPLRLDWSAVVLFLAALGVSFSWMWLTREPDLAAAVRLDEVAGLRERLSTAWHCRTQDDSFARAVVSDAERACTGLTPGQYLRLQTPQPLGWTVMAVLAVALTFAVPRGWLKATDANQGASPQDVAQTRLAIKRELQALKQLAEQTPGLQEFKDDLSDIDKNAGGAAQRPVDVRHDAVKRIDRMEDVLKQKRDSLQREAMMEMRQLLRRVKSSDDRDGDVDKLTQSLKKGDFQSAKQEVGALKEKLAKLQADGGDKELTEKLKKQLDELGKQIEQAAKENEPDEQKVRLMGLSEKDMQRIAEQLKKGDLDQVRKDLEQRGLSPVEAQKLAQKLQQRQKAGELAKKLAQAMQKAGQKGGAASNSDAVDSLTMAEAQLGELEMLDQQLAEMDSALESLQGARQSLDTPCGTCKGTGAVGGQSCSTCRGSGNKKGPGMGRRMGQGEGGLASEEATDIDFTKERQKVHSGKGSIIGQVLVEGDQVRGDFSPELRDVATAAERDASDRINRDRVPRQYQKAVKSYFSTMHEAMEKKSDNEPGNGGSSDSTTPKASPDDHPE